jgi:hypothetical protein
MDAFKEEKQTNRSWLAPQWIEIDAMIIQAHAITQQ